MRFVPSALAVGWAAVIFALSASPDPPGSSGIEWQANVAHLVLYGALAALVFWAIRSVFPGTSTRVVVVSAWLISVAYGCSDEFHQSYVAGRTASVADLGFDAAGSALALLVVVAVSAARMRTAGVRRRTG